MQGPEPPRPTRRAGDSGNANGMPDGGLKDWQKNTWYGPVPYNTNPFEEPDDAPELLEQRSSSVSDRSGEFWNDRPASGYRFSEGKGKENKAPSGEKTGKRRGRESLIPFRAVGFVLLMAAAAALVLFFGVFRIREIKVVGNRDVSATDIIRFSGIRRGGSILTLSEDETQRNLLSSAAKAAMDQGNYNYYRLEFRYLEKEMPGTVTIAVREREACCWCTWGGIMYVMDKNGMVLYETENLDMRSQVQLTEVKGLTIRSGAQAGQTIVLSSAAQETLFRDLFLEMKITGCTQAIREADLSNPDSVLLTTRDPFTVSLGDGGLLHAKLRSMLLVRGKLLEMGKNTGSINVSNPESPFYSPSSPQ